jgi:hypothetical protein
MTETRSGLLWNNEDDTYYLASLKLSAWMSKTGQYTSDITQARELTYPEAIAVAKRHKQASAILVPVAASAMRDIG